MFGKDVVERFLHANGCIRIYRAHQLCQEGYQELFDGQLATVWSAPNYCYKFGNLASILELDENLEGYFNIFEDSPDNGLDQMKQGQRWTSASAAAKTGAQRMRSLFANDDFFT